MQLQFELKLKGEYKVGEWWVMVDNKSANTI